ncbi:MAG: tetratricopeptide repeat protein [Candidatus Eisenbacteria bacterium]|nr:tetratricopeptide repeat protein [Candidatus Eisenbacteria bacterium]
MNTSRKRAGSKEGIPIPSESIGRVARIAIPALIGVLAFLAFSAALDAEFVNYDDDRLYAGNPMYRGFGPVQLQWMWTTHYMGHYQPLTWMSAALDYEISGVDPSSYHRTNLILHALNAALFYFVLLLLLSAARASASRSDHEGLPRAETGHAGGRAAALAIPLAAAFGALFYALHPLRVESVAWASERRDVLSGFFLLLALLAYLRAVALGKAALRSKGLYFASLAALALSLLSKAWGMSFFAVLLLLDIYPLRRLSSRTLRSSEGQAVLLEKLPFLLLGLGAAIVAGSSQKGALQTMKSLAEWSVGDRIVQAFYGLAFYLGKTLWPSKLVALYELPAKLNPWEARFLASYAVVIVIAIAVWLLRRRIPALIIAALAYAFILAPVLGFAQSGPQLVADKYTYVSGISLAALASAGFLWLWNRAKGRETRSDIAREASRESNALTGPRIALALAAAAVLLALGIAAHRQTQVWQDSEHLWRHALAAGRPTAGAHLNYGLLLAQRQKDAEARAHFEQAVAIRPQEGEAWYQLAQILRRERRLDEAEQAYRRATETMPLKHLAYLNLGILLREMGRPREATEALRLAVEHVAPLFGSAQYTTRPYLLLGIALREQGDDQEARRWLEVAARFPETGEQARAELARIPGYAPPAVPSPIGH